MKVSVVRLPKIKLQKLKEINEAFEESSRDLTASYPPTEKLTWPTQHSEAMAWYEDNSLPTPYLDGLARVRRIPAEALRNKTAEKVNLFLIASQALVGIRQRLEDRINLAQNMAAVEAIQWPSQEELEAEINDHTQTELQARNL